MKNDLNEGEVVLGTLETRNWSFEVIGKSERECRALLKAAWAKHRIESGAMMTWAEAKIAAGFRIITLGTVYRDQRVFFEEGGQ